VILGGNQFKSLISSLGQEIWFEWIKKNQMIRPFYYQYIG